MKMSYLKAMAEAANAKCNMTTDEMFDSIIEGIKRESAFITRFITNTSGQYLLRVEDGKRKFLPR